MRFAGNQAKFVLLAAWSSSPSWSKASSPTTTASSRRATRTSVTLGRAPLLASLQRAAILTSEKFKGVRLEHRARRCCASRRATPSRKRPRKSSRSTTPATPIEIGFNVTYLIDALANMSARRWSSVELQDASSSSALITVPEQAGFKYVVMPMRI